MYLADPVKKVYANAKNPTVDRIIAMRDRYLPEFTLILVGRAGGYHLRGLRLGKRTILILSYLPSTEAAHLFTGLEPLRFDVMLPYIEYPIAESKVADEHATGKIIIANTNRTANIAVYVDRKNKSAVLNLNPVMTNIVDCTRCAQRYMRLVEIEIAQIFARLAATFHLDETRYLDGVLTLIDAYTIPKISLTLSNIIIDTTNTYTVKASITSDGIIVKLRLRGHPIHGYTMARKLDNVQGARIVRCELDEPPKMHGEIAIRWDVRGKPVEMWQKNFTVLWRGKEYAHENVSIYGDVCTGTWKVPKLDLNHDVAEQIRRAVKSLIAVLEYPNVAHRFPDDVVQIGGELARVCRPASHDQSHNRNVEEEVVWEA